MDTNTIRLSFVHNRKNRLNKNGQAFVQLQAYLPKSRKRKYISTETYVTPHQWDSTKLLVINHPLSDFLNSKLYDLKSRYHKKVLDLTRKNGVCTIEDLSRDYTSAYLSFTEFYDQEIEIAKSNRADGTIKTYKSALIKLKEYRKSIFFGDLDYKFVQGFDGYLHSCKLRQTVVAKYHKILKRMISQALKKSLIDFNPYDRFPIKSGEPTPRV